MARPYKLTKEIEQFIIDKKTAEPKSSCRGLIPIIRQRFNLTLSKSLINRIIKENSLSNQAVGRKAEKESISVPIKTQIEPIKQPQIQQIEPIIEPIEFGSDFLKNGGCFILLASDLKLSLSSKIAHNISLKLPNLSREYIQKILEALIFVSVQEQDSVGQYLSPLADMPILDFDKALNNSGITYNFNNINELHKIFLSKLSSYAQVSFFTPAYEYLDLSAMYERFYSLWAKLEESPQFLKAKMYYPNQFSWKNDIVWQEDFSSAVINLNEANILNKENKQIWINSLAEILP